MTTQTSDRIQLNRLKWSLKPNVHIKDYSIIKLQYFNPIRIAIITFMLTKNNKQADKKKYKYKNNTFIPITSFWELQVWRVSMGQEWTKKNIFIPVLVVCLRYQNYLNLKVEWIFHMGTIFHTLLTHQDLAMSSRGMGWSTMHLAVLISLIITFTGRLWQSG